MRIRYERDPFKIFERLNDMTDRNTKVAESTKMNPTSIDPEQSELELAFCRATLYSALALGFRPPTEEAIARLATSQNAAALGQAAALLDIDGKLALVSLVQAVAHAGTVGALP